MNNAQSEQKFFWNLFNQTLADTDFPFTIATEKHWAVVNRETTNWSGNIISMDFLIRKKLLRINAYLNNDEALFNKLLGHRKEIEEKLGFTPIWAHGEKGENTYRIKVELPFRPYDRENYCRVIDNAIPIVRKYISAFKPYIQC